MDRFNRRQFLYSCSAAAVCLAASANPCHAFLNWGKNGSERDIRGEIFKGGAPDSLWKWSREAMDYRQLDHGRVVCGICPHNCELAPGDRSICRSKVNMDGTLYTLAYGNPCSVHLDPIEKKPLFHFLPKSKAFSIATTGCNLRCLNCQNWQISQTTPEEVRTYDLFPEGAVEKAKRLEADAIAYTYSEPVTFYEYLHDTGRKAHQHQLRNVLISNGYINDAPLKRLCRIIDGANINLKSFEDAIYRKLNGGRLQPVLHTLEMLAAENVHFEITTLVVPEYVDDPEMIKSMCRWIVEHLGRNYPLHFLRFSPRYKLDRLPPTPVSTLTRFRKLAMDAGIRYVYVGNVPGHEGVHTYCHNCGKTIIRREGFHIPEFHIAEGKCRFCGTQIPGVWA
ncbi:MAG: AmmeMemoRadiSam system radical SAM enzyme [Thermodesulfobacteriota bacterium]